MALQRAAGNAAVLAALGRGALPDTGPPGPPVVQRGKPKKKVAKKRSAKERTKTNLNNRLHVAMKAAGRAGHETLYDRLAGLAADLKEDYSYETVKEIRTTLGELQHRHAVLIQNAAPPHPAGSDIADSAGNLNPGIVPRTRFYGAFLNHAKVAKAAWVNGHTDPLTGLVRCPGNPPAIAAHDVAPTAITIDHKVAVCVHWNNGWGAYAKGCDTGQATRTLFYSDVSNHEYLCGPCNNSKGSGYQFYTRKIGMNFRR